MKETRRRPVEEVEPPGKARKAAAESQEKARGDDDATRRLLLGVLVSMTGCRAVKPDFGEEAVLIRKPWFFGHGGVVPAPVQPGLDWVAITTDYVIVNMQPQQYGVHFEDLMSSDGVPLDFDAVIRLQVTNSVSLITEFGEDWFQRNVQAEFQNRVRQLPRPTSRCGSSR